MRQIAITQGRLVPPYNRRIQQFPTDNWQEDIFRTARAGIKEIEWIYDGFSGGNPIETSSGVLNINALIKIAGVCTTKISVDWIMENPLIRCNEKELTDRLSFLTKVLFNQVSFTEITTIILPFVDNAAINTERELEEVAALLNDVILVCPEFRNNFMLLLETSLNARGVRKLLNRVKHPRFGINYDSGNSASLGHNVDEEFEAYADRIYNIHIKDRELNGESVPLGKGNADFDKLFKNLKAINYKGPFTLQAARGEIGDEINWAIKNREWLEKRLQ
jgi:L-ribulose-5-phosphate 3-epimerase